MALDTWKDIATIGGTIIALGTLVKAVAEYTIQGAQKRAEHFIALRKRFKENEEFLELCSLIDMNDPKLAEMEFKSKRDLLGFFEEIALFVNSGLIRKQLAHYMFGYYALRCWECKYFWTNINRDSHYWALFRAFVMDMKIREREFKFDNREFKF
ncbi:DUF4760 domain-containing protein [Geothrix sp.]|uniref:DUF4760 domain-containing protein n=1 Tax=Geothrix sp. TaxID=1962974 RepID=UPI002632B2B7|nr:hypothetical protein [Geothrix sp.]WIL19438.1 MAG: hypothetical protein QOZ81_001955 [Geothrix sp.]WIL21373.1 MAG: hypothetical protein QOZ81_000632 [Geothrix sp.]